MKKPTNIYQQHLKQLTAGAVWSYTHAEDDISKRICKQVLKLTQALADVQSVLEGGKHADTLLDVADEIGGLGHDSLGGWLHTRHVVGGEVEEDDVQDIDLDALIASLKGADDGEVWSWEDLHEHLTGWQKQDKPTKKKVKKHQPRPPAPKGTQQDGRGNRTRNRRHPEIPEDHVREIRWLCRNTQLSNQEIRKLYGRSRESISHIRNGIRRANVRGTKRPSWFQK